MPSYRTIREGMALAIMEDALRDESSVPHPLPAAAKHAADDLVKLYTHANGKSPRELMPEGRDLGQWGYALGVQALREGGTTWRRVSRFDRLPRWVVVPKFKVEFHGDELEWSGELADGSPTGWNNSGRRNPTIPSEEEYLGETLGAPEINPAGKRWFVFYYEGTWRKKPKQYWGPFSTRNDAIATRDKDAAKYDTPFTRYKIQSLSDRQFAEIWGSEPHHALSATGTARKDNPAADRYYIGHRDGAEVEIDAEHGKFDTLDDALEVARKMDAATRHRSLIVRQGNAYEQGSAWYTDVTLYSIATGELLLQQNPHWDKSEIQSLLFDVHHFSEAQAKAWARQHGFHYGDVDNTANYHRLRQFPPAGGPCRTIELGHDGIKAVVCSVARGKPPWIANPGHKFIGGRVSVWPRRTPTIEEIAAAWHYIDNEYTLKDGGVDGEQWAEGLAFWTYAPSRDELAVAREIKPQLTDAQWQSIAARADYLRFEQHEPPRYAPEGQ